MMSLRLLGFGAPKGGIRMPKILQQTGIVMSLQGTLLASHAVMTPPQSWLHHVHPSMQMQSSLMLNRLLLQATCCAGQEVSRLR